MQLASLGFKRCRLGAVCAGTLKPYMAYVHVPRERKRLVCLLKCRSDLRTGEGGEEDRKKLYIILRGGSNSYSNYSKSLLATFSFLSIFLSVFYSYVSPCNLLSYFYNHN